MQRVFTVKAEWDEDAGVWYVSDSDVPGLATEAPTVEELEARILAIVPDLVDLNRETLDGDESADIPVHVLASKVGHARLPR
jgi:hypothetical protein